MTRTFPYRDCRPTTHTMSTLLSCNLTPKTLNPKLPFTSRTKTINPRTITISPPKSLNGTPFKHPLKIIRARSFLSICQNSFSNNNSEKPISEEAFSVEKKKLGDGNGGNGWDWTTSILLFGLWVALLYYVFRLAPDQTPSRDLYFLQKLLNLKGDDGFRMNEVLVSLWYIMGLWPLVYSMLLLPSGRSSQSKIPLWPFLVLSCFGGAYALLPYFVLWRPPTPAVDEADLGKWPLNFLESKITAGILFAAGLGIITYAGLASGDVWKEFYQYFRESKFIHATCLDFSLLSAFSPFWVYNDMTSRKWFDKGSWLLPVAFIPFLGPALYLVLRPPLSTISISLPSTSIEGD